jgi:GNAT superfamily N-acetyltransferase
LVLEDDRNVLEIRGAATFIGGIFMRIRTFESGTDLAFLRRCVVELQTIEHGYDPRLPSGPAMVDAYCAELQARSRAWRGAFFVAMDEDQPVGLLTLFLAVPRTEPDEPPGSYALISDLVVVEEARGRGVGAALVARAEAEAAAAGVEVLRLEVMAGNEGARRFYQRRGWKERVVQLEKPLPGGLG